MFALRCAVFSLNFFLNELPLKSSLHFFFDHQTCHRILLAQQSNTSLKSQLNISVSEVEENKVNGEETTKGKTISN